MNWSIIAALLALASAAEKYGLPDRSPPKDDSRFKQKPAGHAPPSSDFHGKPEKFEEGEPHPPKYAPDYVPPVKDKPAPPKPDEYKDFGPKGKFEKFEDHEPYAPKYASDYVPPVKDKPAPPKYQPNRPNYDESPKFKHFGPKAAFENFKDEPYAPSEYAPDYVPPVKEKPAPPMYEKDSPRYDDSPEYNQEKPVKYKGSAPRHKHTEYAARKYWATATYPTPTEAPHYPQYDAPDAYSYARPAEYKPFKHVRY